MPERRHHELAATPAAGWVLDHLDHGRARPRRLRHRRADPRPVRRAVRRQPVDGRSAVRLVLAGPVRVRADPRTAVRPHRTQAGHPDLAVRHGHRQPRHRRRRRAVGAVPRADHRRRVGRQRVRRPGARSPNRRRRRSGRARSACSARRSASASCSARRSVAWRRWAARTCRSTSPAAIALVNGLRRHHPPAGDAPASAPRRAAGAALGAAAARLWRLAIVGVRRDRRVQRLRGDVRLLAKRRFDLDRSRHRRRSSSCIGLVLVIVQGGVIRPVVRPHRRSARSLPHRSELQRRRSRRPGVRRPLGRCSIAGARAVDRRPGADHAEPHHDGQRRGRSRPPAR